MLRAIKVNVERFLKVFFFKKKNYYIDFQAGKRVLMFSYGSGLTATMFSFQLQNGQHPFSLLNIAMVMNVSEKLKSRLEVFLLLTALTFLDIS